MFKTRGNYVLFLIEVGFFCDFIIIVWMCSFIISSVNNTLPILNVVMDFRLIPETIVVLFNKKSRDIWSKYFKKRRNNRFNNLVM